VCLCVCLCVCVYVCVCVCEFNLHTHTHTQRGCPLGGVSSASELIVARNFDRTLTGTSPSFSSDNLLPVLERLSKPDILLVR